MKQNQTTYWLSILPSTFIFEGDKYVLFYETYFKKKIITKKTNNIEKIRKKIQNINQLYCVLINQKDLEQSDIKDWIKQMSNNYMAELYPAICSKPVTIPPIMKCHEELRGDINESNILVLLNELTFHINGLCSQKCDLCSKYKKQFNCCYKNQGELPLEAIKNILNSILYTTPSLKINFNGGNIFLYSQIMDLLEYLKQNQLKSNIYLHYINWNENYYQDIYSCNIYLHIFVNFPIQVDFLKILISHNKELDKRIKFNFIITSEEEIETLQIIINQFKIENYSVLPFYDGTNQPFFEKYVYIGENEIQEESPSKKDIYKRQKFNMNDMGKLSISSDGKYFSNLNFQSLGSIDDNICSIIQKEWKEGKAWKRTRNQKPCTECIYQYICPSPSNYDLILNKIDLCQDEIKYKSSI